MMTSFGIIPIRWIWVGLVIVFSLIEVFTFGLTTIWFALGALVMVFLSFIDIPLAWQILIFLAISAVLLIFTRPLAIKKFKAGKAKTNVDTLIDRPALVTKTITEFDKGEIKIHGVIWSAYSEDNTEIKEGTKCIIVRIEGVQAIVRPLPEKANT
ncbi:MAG: NfeD family protein [Treponema sp.]|nr:NfeD family protein [Treponema sp.]